MQSYAQQDVTFTLYNYNMNIINPAYAGTGEHLEFTSNFRSQWVGLGLSIIDSSVFVPNETDIFADFSYKLQLEEKLDLFLGLKAGGAAVNIALTGVHRGRFTLK